MSEHPKRGGRFAFNVKSYAGPCDLDADAWDALCVELDLGGILAPIPDDEPTPFGPEWYRARFGGADQGPTEPALINAWELAEDDARELFGRDVEVYSEGRSGGWLVVHGVGVDGDELDLGCLRDTVEALERFGEYVRAGVADFPRLVAWHAGGVFRADAEELATRRERDAFETFGRDAVRILRERGFGRGCRNRARLWDGLARDGFRELATLADERRLLDHARATEHLGDLDEVSREPGDPERRRVREARDAALGIRGEGT